MLDFFKSLFSKKRCYFCKTTGGPFVRYRDDKAQSIQVCVKCLEYAERRAFKKG